MSVPDVAFSVGVCCCRDTKVNYPDLGVGSRPAALRQLQTGTITACLPPVGPWLGDTISPVCHQTKSEPGQGSRGPSSHTGPLARMGITAQPVLRDPDIAQVLKSLNKTYQNLKKKPVAVDLDPKAVTCDELFGVINPATREWKDGNRSGKPGAGCTACTGPGPTAHGAP